MSPGVRYHETGEDAQQNAYGGGISRAGVRGVRSLPTITAKYGEDILSLGGEVAARRGDDG